MSSAPTVSFTLNGQPVQAPAGQSIFNIARSLGIDIPHLCHKEGLAPDGNCSANCNALPPELSTVPAPGFAPFTNVMLPARVAAFAAPTRPTETSRAAPAAAATDHR